MYRLCVIGDPVAHSRSPAIHTALLRQRGLEGIYTTVTVREGELEAFVAEARQGAWDGFNVTMPHKQAILPLLDAVNIDLKGFTERWYARLGGDLETVKRSIVLAAQSCHVEVTTLVVPGENDSEEEMRALSAWRASVSPDIPLHVSRFFPRHRMQDRPPTQVSTVYRLAEVARERLRYVYTGNC